MERAFTAAGLVRYDDKRGMAGRLKGLITFTDGKSLKVWDVALHETCKQLARTPVGDVRYTFKHSETWGDSLSSIESLKAEHERYDDARARDEQSGGAYAKAGSWLGNRISKRVQKDISDEQDDLMGRVG